MNAPSMAQQLPFLLRGFASPSSDAEPKDEAERAPDFHEIANKNECGARVLYVLLPCFLQSVLMRLVCVLCGSFPCHAAASGAELSI